MFININFKPVNLRI